VTPIVAPNGSPTAALSDDINESSHLIAECRLSSATIACTFDDDRTLRPGLSRRHTWQRQMPQEERRAGYMWKVTAINESSDLRILLGWFQNVAPGIYRVQCSSQDLEVAGLERPRLIIIHPRSSYVAGLKWFRCGVDEAVLAVLLDPRKHKADFRFTVLLSQLARSLCLFSSARPTVHDTVPPPAKQGSLRGAGRIVFFFCVSRKMGAAVARGLFFRVLQMQREENPYGESMHILDEFTHTVSLRPYPVRMLAYWHMDGTHSVS